MTGNAYETERYLHEYLLFHYGRPKDLCPFAFVPRKLLRFHQRIRQECLLPLKFEGKTRGLDLGCAVGRFAFEMGCVVDQVLGIDNSKRFVHAAGRMAKTHVLTAQLWESGDHFTARRLTLPRSLRRGSVEFQLGDALELRGFAAGSFHLVAAINLLCRLPQPRRFLSQLHRLIPPNGQLILASPFSWLEEFTPRGEWLSSQDLLTVLRPHFRLARRRDLPFLIREHRRKYQLVFSEVYVFVRTAECSTQIL